MVHYTQSYSGRRGEAPLEPNHTEFIFVDDESANRDRSERGFRRKLEQALSNGFFTSDDTVDSSSQGSLQIYNVLYLIFIRQFLVESIPVILLVIEGGPNTILAGIQQYIFRDGFDGCLSLVHETIVQNNIPVLFFEGTGRCCDLFGKALRLYTKHCLEMDLNRDK